MVRATTAIREAFDATFRDNTPLTAPDAAQAMRDLAELILNCGFGTSHGAGLWSQVDFLAGHMRTDHVPLLRAAAARVDALGVPAAGLHATPVQAGTGLSFGYRVRAMNKQDYRELTDLDLIEVSVVTHPMQPLARVLAVEAAAAGTTSITQGE
mgnify:CR=1 FL=1